MDVIYDHSGDLTDTWWGTHERIKAFVLLTRVAVPFLTFLLSVCTHSHRLWLVRSMLVFFGFSAGFKSFWISHERMLHRALTRNPFLNIDVVKYLSLNIC